MIILRETRRALQIVIILIITVIIVNYSLVKSPIELTNCFPNFGEVGHKHLVAPAL